MTLKPILLGAAALLCLSSAPRAQNQEAVGLGELGPVPADYRARIVSWAKFFFPDTRILRRPRISEPVLIRDTTGRLLWLVCVEAENDPAPNAQPQRWAIGFGSVIMTAPRNRNGSSLSNDTCDQQPLAWRAFPELNRS